MDKTELMALSNKVKDYAMTKDIDEAEVFFSYTNKLEILSMNQSIATERDIMRFCYQRQGDLIYCINIRGCGNVIKRIRRC